MKPRCRTSSGARHEELRGAPRSCDNFLYGLQGRTFGVPGQTGPRPGTREGRAQPSGEEGGRSEPGRSGQRLTRGFSPSRAGQLRRVLRTRALRPRRLPRTAPPVTRRPVPAATSPMPRGASWSCRQASRQVRRSPGEMSVHRAGTPRIVRGGPSGVKGAPSARRMLRKRNP